MHKTTITTKLQRSIIICMTFLLLTSCKWSNWRTFKNKCESDFTKYVKVERDTTLGKISFSKPILTPKDVKLVSKKEPSKTEIDGKTTTAHFICIRTGENQPEHYNLNFQIIYNQNSKMTTFKFPRQFCEMFPNDDSNLTLMIRKILQADLNFWGDTLSNQVHITPKTLLKLPSKDHLISVYGLSDAKNPHTLAYNYTVKADPKDSTAVSDGRKVQISFSFNEQKQMTRIKMTMSSVIIDLTVNYTK